MLCYVAAEHWLHELYKFCLFEQRAKCTNLLQRAKFLLIFLKPIMRTHLQGIIIIIIDCVQQIQQLNAFCCYWCILLDHPIRFLNVESADSMFHFVAKRYIHYFIFISNGSLNKTKENIFTASSFFFIKSNNFLWI